MALTVNDIVIVLCRPSEAGNAGAVCRAMKNLSFSRLRLVSPPALDAERVKQLAVHAFDVFEAAEIYGTLKEAVADCSFVVGTTRRRGEKRKPTASVREIALFLKNRPAFPEGGKRDAAAIVFGNERTGLTKEELNLCSAASHIPASPAFPSLNLSHAVQIYCYELFCALQEGVYNEPQGQWKPLNQDEINKICGETYSLLKKCGFYANKDNFEQLDFFRSILSRAAVTQKEADYLKTILLKAGRLISARP
ncbi:MAG: RNA methyltransferase [Spirochaetaceae bacterium]|jgi:tRNA/rRNA methyltransferase/tRNA (cytidine32/uridine32-2'-O)-methyltransferase|nr:RNA methyltransferase [Spirochaetaceae bacterium]